MLVGLITRPHGIRGEVKVDVLSDVPNRFDPGRELLLTGDGRSAHNPSSVRLRRNVPSVPLRGDFPPVRLRRSVRITSSRLIRGGAIIRFDGCQTREEAEILRGSRLEIPRSEVPAAPAGLYYHFDLVGCRCIDAEHGELGEVSAVVEDGGGVLLEITRADRILPVPFVEAFLESVDVVRKQIRLRLPPGLVEACESRS